MADSELAALRAARLNQLQQSGTDNNGQGAARSDEAEKRRAEEQMKRDLLASALEPAARERRMGFLLVVKVNESSSHFHSVPHRTCITFEIESDRVNPPTDGTNGAAPRPCQRAATH